MLGATIASAHIIPIPPSQCRFDPLTLSAPARDAEGRAAEVADDVRIVYDANASVIRLCSSDAGDTCVPGTARSFTLGAASGTIGFPARAGGTMESSGDMLLPDAAVVVSVGGVPTTVPVTLTTGLALVDGAVVEGAPLQGLQGFTLVGVLDGALLPVPFAGQSIALSVSCQPRPIPDKDQFVAPSRLARLRGEITATGARLRATIVRGQADLPNFARGPILLTIRIDDQRVATVVVSTGLQGGRRATSVSDDGRATLTVTKRSATHFGLSLDLHEVALPAATGATRAIVGVTLDTGGILARGERLFRPTASRLQRR